MIVADLFHPGRDGAGALYAREHFANVKAHLRAGGLFAQWLPLYQLDDETLRLIVRTFLTEFDEAYAWLGIYNVQTPAVMLLGRAPGPDGGPLYVDVERLTGQLQKPVYADLLMTDPRDLFAGYLLDHDGLVAFAGDGPLNDDMHPRVATIAPRSAYLPDPWRGRDNLAALLAARVAVPASLLGNAPETMAAQTEAFARALDLYLRAEAARLEAAADEPPGPRPVAAPMNAVEAYLQAYEAAPEFTAARGMLYLLARQGQDYAEAIYPRMLAATPEEPRVYQEYLGYLQRIGDQDRLQRVLQRAQANVEGLEISPGPAPAPAPEP